MPSQPTNPDYRVYPMDVSYFSGKLEAYLRYKEIPFERVEVGWRQLGREVFPHTGDRRALRLEARAHAGRGGRSRPRTGARPRRGSLSGRGSPRGASTTPTRS